MVTGLRRNDVVPGALVALHLFLAVASTILGKAVRDAIFLSGHTPVQLIAADLATVVAVAVVVGMQLRLKARMSTKRLLLISPFCFALGDFGLYFGMSRLPGDWMARVAYLWIGVQASFGAPQASLLGYHVLTLRQARRMCGVVGAGATLGWIGGGLLTELVAAHFGALSLLLGAGALTALCPVVVAAAWRAKSDTTLETNFRVHPDTSGDLRRSARFVWASPQLRAVAALALFSSAVSTIAGLQFKIVASESIGATDHLAAFFGSFSSHAGLAAFATQLLLTCRIVEGLGLGPALLIAPAALAAGSVGVLLSGGLAAAVFLKASDQVLRHSVDRAAVEFLYCPLSDREVFEGKTFIDAFICRAGDAIGGIVVLFSTIVLGLSFSWLSAISLVLLAGWFLSADIARRCHRVRLLENLQVHGPSGEGAQAFARTRKRFDRRSIGQRGILDADPAMRLDSLHALAPVRGRGADVRVDKTMLTTALAAEIVGLAMLAETSAAGAPVADDRCEARDTIERIARLLFLFSRRVPRLHPPGALLRHRGTSGVRPGIPGQHPPFAAPPHAGVPPRTLAARRRLIPNGGRFFRSARDASCLRMFGWMHPFVLGGVDGVGTEL